MPYIRCGLKVLLIDFYVYQLILIIFSRNIAKYVSSQIVLYFPTSPNLCFCTTWEHRNTKIACFHSNVVLLLFQSSTNR